MIEFRTEILNRLDNIDNTISKNSEQLFETQKFATISAKTPDEALMLTNENKQQLDTVKLEMEDILYTMNEGQSAISGNELIWYETAKKLNDTLLEIDKNLQKDEIIELIERAPKLPKTPKNV